MPYRRFGILLKKSSVNIYMKLVKKRNKGESYCDSKHYLKINLISKTPSNSRRAEKSEERIRENENKKVKIEEH